MSDPIDYNTLSRGARVIHFIENFCKVPEGSMVGQPMRLARFQKRFILAIYNNKHTDTRQAYLSIARKNGKTGLTAGLLLAHIVGPEAQQNSQIISGAMSRDQAALVFKLASKMVMLNPDLEKVCRIVPSAKMIIGLTLNVEYKAVSADASTAHGMSPVLAILDEIGQIVGPTSAFIDAITTSQGAYEKPLLLAISTSAASDADMFSIWIDDAVRNSDPATVAHIYKADEEADLLDERAMKAANPALDLFRSRADLLDKLTKASRMPSQESAARNLLLNQRVSLETLFISANLWKENAGEPDLDVFRTNQCSIGLDLSAKNDLTAACLAAKDDNGDIHVYPFVFCPTHGIEDRAKRDRAPYDLWVKEGKLIPIGGASMDYDQIAEYLRDELEDMEIDPYAVCFDRWRIDIFKKSCENCGAFPFAEWQEVGQGYQSQSPSLEALMSLLLNQKVRHGGHPLLNMAAAHAIGVRDPAGNVKLAKNKSTLRIDPLIAMHQAVYAVSDGNLEEEFDAVAMIG